MTKRDLIGNVGLRIKYFRSIKGITQCELAEKMGADEKAVSQIETGKRNITLKTLEKIIRALDVLPEKLFRFDD